MFSCATAQDNVSMEARRKVEQLRSMISLSPQQVKDLTRVESRFLQGKARSHAAGNAYPKLI